MTGFASISASGLAAVSALGEGLPSDEATALDPFDPTHRAAIQVALTAAGRSPDRYPALHAGLDGGTARAGDALTLIDKGRDRSGRATAMTWYAAGPEALYAGGSLFAFDGDSGELLAFGHNSNVGDGFVPVSTDTPTAKLAGKSLKVLAVNHSVSQAGEVSFTGLASTTQVWPSSGEANIQVNQPTQSPQSPPNVLIALGRKSMGTDADYTYLEPQDLGTPYLIVPFLGNASIGYSIDGTPGQPIEKAILTTMIYFVSGGTTGTVQLKDGVTDKFRAAVTINASDQTILEWRYPYDQNSYTNTKSLVYGQQSLVNEQVAYFFYNFQIPTHNGPPSYSFTICSKDTPNDRSLQCFIVPNIRFWWHCLAEGTRIRLADGGEAPIEAIDNTHRVKTCMPGVTDLAVEATSKGLHKAGASDAGHSAVYRLITDQGHELVGSGQHVIKTPGGLAALSDLRPGDEVTAETGIVRVASCESIDWDGGLCNLKLGNEDDRAAGLAADVACTYVANGLVVGDHLAMNAEQHRLARDLEHTSARLPDGLKADYASALQDIRY
jgi:hypothetical protein